MGAGPGRCHVACGRPRRGLGTLSGAPLSLPFLQGSGHIPLAVAAVESRVDPRSLITKDPSPQAQSLLLPAGK